MRPNPVCDCCGRKVLETRKSAFWTGEVCKDCIYEWYEGGMTDPATIKAAVLKQHGEFGGAAAIVNEAT